MSSRPLVTINLVVHNGEKYIRHCLDAVKAQTYEHFEVNILDNASTDATTAIIAEEYPSFTIIRSRENLGAGGGWEEALKSTRGEFVVALSVDIILEPRFIENSVNAFEQHPKAGALQPKMFRYDLINDKPHKTSVIDSVGFEIYRSRRLLNRGSGQQDNVDFANEEEIFSYEGASAIFRRTALEDARIQGEIYDHDLWWYATDIDLGWKLRMLGWESWYVPSIIAWHDRPTSKDTRTSMKEYATFSRQHARAQIPRKRRRLQFRNYHLVLIKYEFVSNLLRDAIPFLFREIGVLGYHALFEPFVFAEIPAFFKRLPAILRKRKAIRKRSQISAGEIRRWYR